MFVSLQRPIICYCRNRPIKAADNCRALLLIKFGECTCAERLFCC
jgi:hypothetical protein